MSRFLFRTIENYDVRFILLHVISHNIIWNIVSKKIYIRKRKRLNALLDRINCILESIK